MYTVARISAALVAVVAVGGCAGTGSQSDTPRALRTTAVGTDCFTISQARDFRFLDDRNLIVFAPRGQPYHVQLSYACLGLRGRVSIGLNARTDRMCGFAGDAVVVEGTIPERCPVMGVTRLDEDGLLALLDRFDAAGSPDGVTVTEIPVADDDEGEREAGGEPQD